MTHKGYIGVKPRWRVDKLLELCSPFLTGGNFAFIAAIASSLFPKNANINHSNNYGPYVPNREKIGSNNLVT